MLVQYFKQIIKTLIIVLICFICTSCWSSVHIEEQIYVTAIGVDFEDEEYTIYAQVHNFNSIVELKQRSNESSGGTFVGTGKGASMYEAAQNLAKSAQAKIDWGHADAIVVSERAFAKDGIDIPRRIYRFPDTRYNTWFYVTNSSILDLFTKGNIYDESSLSTIMFNPESTYHQKTTVKPLLTFDLVAKLSEPDRTIAIPSIKINDEQWSTGAESIELMEVDSAYFVSLYGKPISMKLDDIPGFKLLQYPSRTKVSIEQDHEHTAEFTVVPDRKSYKVKVVAGEPKFSISMLYIATLFELHEEMSNEEVVEKIRKKMEEDIRQTYLEGIKKEVDIYNLMPKLRHKYPELWNSLTEGGKQFILNEDSLDQITLDVRIPYYGKYKLTPESSK